MKALLPPLFFAAIILPSLTAQEDKFSDKRVVRVIEEPRHRIVHVQGDLYLLDVQIQVGDTTLPHIHDSAILYTFISLARDGLVFGQVNSITEYAAKPFTHEVSNSGEYLLHIIALANYGPGAQSSPTMSQLLGEPLINNSWFCSYRVELEPGERIENLQSSNPSVIIQVTDGAAHVTRQDGYVEELGKQGHWAWRNENTMFSLSNAGADPISIVINEGRL